MFGKKKQTRGVPGRRQVREAPTEQPAAQFRRNQTLVNARYERPETDMSDRARTHHLTLQRRKVGGIFLITLVVIAVLILLLSQFTARAIVSGSTDALTRPIDAGKYEAIIRDYLGIHPVERLRFALNETELSAFATTIAPEVGAIRQTNAENFVETHFVIEFRRPVAGWQINGRQNYVDQAGVVFGDNYYEAPSVQIVDQSGISPEQGSTVASGRFLSFVGRVVALSRAGGYTVTEAILPADTTRQLQVRLKDVTPVVKLSIDRGAGEQVEDMIRSLNYLNSRGAKPGYVDVRVSGKAVYL